MRLKLRNVFVGCALAVGVAATTYVASTVDLDSVKSQLIEWMSVKKPIAQPRDVFRNLPFLVYPPSKSHSHGEAAADRAAALSFMDEYFTTLALQPYHVQMSNKDQLANREGSRVFFWSKDLSADYRSLKKIPENRGICLTDVDYYLDMNDFLARRGANGKPLLIYTIVPEKVASNDNGIAFTFTPEGKFKMSVSGGAVYEHELWDYTRDTMLVVRRWLGIPISATAYVVERRTTSIPHHSLLCLVPIRVFGFSGAWLASLLSDDKLVRLDPRVEGTKYTRLDVLTKEGLVRSTGVAGQYIETTVNAQIDDGVSNMAVASAVTLPVATVQGYTGIEDKGGAAVLTQFHRDKILKDAPMVVKVDIPIQHYQYASAVGFDEDPKPGCEAYMPPLVGGAAYAPMRCLGNDEQAVRGRITSIASNAKVTPHLSHMMNEFLDNFVVEPNSLIPVDIDEVFDRQDRPSQRRLLFTSDMQDPKRMISMFMKREIYADVKDPRPISTINPTDKRDYSTFMYALYPMFKATNWYAFGLTPVEIAERVSMVCSRRNTDFVIETDFSRFDGRVSEVLRELERRLLARSFQPKFIDTALALHRSQYGLIGRTSYGAVYDTGLARCSGSPETALFNSLANAFVAYLCFRDMGLDPRVAYLSLGIYGGDDGITPNVHPAVCETAGASVGQVIKAKLVLRKRPVTFLARIFGPGVWYGDGNSCCDILRQITKLHTCVSNAVKPEEKFIEKMRSFSLTDRNTPIFSDLCRALETNGVDLQADRIGDETTWFGQFDRTVQFPNMFDEWMMEIVLETMPTFDFMTLHRHCHHFVSLEHFVANMPMCYKFDPAPIPATVLVNGENDVMPAVPEPLPEPTAPQPSNVGNPPSPVIAAAVIQTSAPAGTKKAPPKPSVSTAGSDKKSKNSRRKEKRNAKEKPKPKQQTKANEALGAKF